jgi:hypothetical protein
MSSDRETGGARPAASARRAGEAAATRGEASPRVGLWVGGVAAAVTALLIHAGWTTGEWRGVIVSEVQVVIVAGVTYFGLRAGR